MTLPMIQPKQPILPTKLNRSFRKMALKMVVMTTLKAPSGVTSMASVNEYATKLQISPMIMSVMPIHHQRFFRYP